MGSGIPSIPIQNTGQVSYVQTDKNNSNKLSNNNPSQPLYGTQPQSTFNPLMNINTDLSISSKGFILPNGAVLNEGTICFKDGVWFVKANQSATISGVMITASNENVICYFDGEEHLGNYVSLNAQNKKIAIGFNKAYDVEFTQSNPFILVEENDSFAVKFIDVFLGENLQPHQMILKIENRDSSGLIPKVTISGKGANLQIVNGKRTVNFVYNDYEDMPVNIMIDYQLDPNNVAPVGLFSVPMEVTWENSGKTLEMKENDETENAQKTSIVINNYGFISYLNSNKEYIARDDPREIVLTGAKESVLHNNWNYQTMSQKEFESQFLNIKLIGDPSPYNIFIAAEFLKMLPPGILSAINGLDFPENDPLRFEYEAYVTPQDNIVHLIKGFTNLTTIFHEAGHTPINSLDQESQKILFERWARISGPRLEIERSGKCYVWDDGSTTPRNGYFNPYSAFNMHEDIATCIEKVYSDPQLVRSLVSTGDIRYRQKIELLYEYGLIDSKHYEIVMGTIINKNNKIV